MKKLKLITCVLIVFCVIVLGSTTSFAGKKIIVSGASIGSLSNLSISAVADMAQNHCGLFPTVVVNPTTIQEDVLYRHEANIATTTGFLAYHAYKKLGQWKKEPFKELRTLLPRPTSQIHIAVLKNSEIRTLQDLAGKKVGFSKPGSAADRYGAMILGALGIYDDLAATLKLAHSEQQAKLLMHQIDAVVYAGSAPSTSITEINLTASGGIRLIPFTEKDIATVLEKAPDFIPSTIPAVYKGIEEPVPSIGYVNTHSAIDLSEEEAYCITKNYFEHIDDVANYWILLGETKLEDVSSFRNLPPWHIGSYKYYKEMGIEIPSEMVPPEAK